MRAIFHRSASERDSEEAIVVDVDGVVRSGYMMVIVEMQREHRASLLAVAGLEHPILVPWTPIPNTIDEKPDDCALRNVNEVLFYDRAW